MICPAEGYIPYIFCKGDEESDNFAAPSKAIAPRKGGLSKRGGRFAEGTYGGNEGLSFVPTTSATQKGEPAKKEDQTSSAKDIAPGPSEDKESAAPMEPVPSETIVLDEIMHDPANMRTIKGDVLDVIGKSWVVHQCNCVSTHPAGLAEQIFNKVPAANMYCIRDDPKYIHRPGSIEVVCKIIN